MERPGATTMRGNPLTLLGPELKAGEKAPEKKEEKPAMAAPGGGMGGMY